jgi:GWxTD domain-containing protein
MLLMAGCGGNVASTKRDNLSYLYGQGTGGIQLSARVHHATPGKSILYYKLPTRDLLYKSDGSGSPFTAKVLLSYEAFADWNSKIVLDSASTLIQDKSLDPSDEKELIGSLNLRQQERSYYILRVTAKDLNRESQTTLILRVEQKEKGIRQYFLPIDQRNGLPRFNDQVGRDEPLKVRCEAYTGKVLFGTFHRSTSTLPSPVFTSVTPNRTTPAADSTFQVAVDPEEGTFTLDLRSPGTYHLRPDTADNKGFSVFVLDESYPYVGSSSDMLRPLRYITSLQEYERISKASNVRQAIERFWIDAASDRERARDAIRIYYGRVENANRHFTAQVEGWRTDRGLVHIIFGIPTTIYRSDLSETWVYGEENNMLSLTFTFTKRDNPFTNNDMILDRDPTLKGAWYRNVESWRNGRVYQN